MTSYDELPVPRRSVLLTGAGTASGILLSGCIVQAPPEAAPPPAAPPSARPSARSAQPSGEPSAEASSEPAQPKQPSQPSQPDVPALARLDDVPVGGGVVLRDEKIVVTRDRSGKAAAFSAVCTHAGCIVATVANGTINCDCHGSRFDAATGAVVNGPASKALDAVPVQQRDGAVFRA